MIKIGSYLLNTEEMTLNRDGSAVKLEPKVLAVLSYFCENQSRYISMAELHENVWQDRCVSDAAVRRAIGKLRQLFNDDHKAPSYIQSLPKRGYKLICQVSQPDNKVISEPSPPLDNVAATKLQWQHQNNQTKSWSKPVAWGKRAVFLSVIIIITLFFIIPLSYRIAANIASAEAISPLNITAIHPLADEKNSDSTIT